MTHYTGYSLGTAEERGGGEVRRKEEVGPGVRCIYCGETFYLLIWREQFNDFRKYVATA